MPVAVVILGGGGGGCSGDGDWCLCWLVVLAREIRIHGASSGHGGGTTGGVAVEVLRPWCVWSVIACVGGALLVGVTAENMKIRAQQS